MAASLWTSTDGWNQVVSELGYERRRFTRIEGAVALEARLQGLPLDQVHDQVEVSALLLTDFVNRYEPNRSAIASSRS